MPEGDTVYITSQRLHAALAGRPVTRFDLRIPALALADLTGATVTEVVPRGKHILMRFSTGQTLHSHLRMDGSWRVGPADVAGPGAATSRSGRWWAMPTGWPPAFGCTT